MVGGKEQAVKNKEAVAPEQEYFFSGGTEYEPVTVTASSPEEAEEKWRAVRKRVEINNQE